MPSLSRTKEGPTQSYEVGRLGDATREIVKAAFHDETWLPVLAVHDQADLLQILRRVIADMGSQEQERLAGLSAARTDDEVDDEMYDVMHRNYQLWLRSASRVRQKVRYRINEIQPSVQAQIDHHQADRRALVILARRIFAWEEGADDDEMDTALDDVTVSCAPQDPSQGRRTLRSLMEEILRREGERP